MHGGAVTLARQLLANGWKVVLADTVKGRGISFMENDPSWHSYRPLSPEELATARKELAG